MAQPQSIKIDNVEYVRADAQPHKMGPVRIIIADRGWVFVGNCEDHEDGTVTITNCRNIRKWGTVGVGLGGLVNGPKPETVVDVYGTVRTLPIAQINVVSGW